MAINNIVWGKGYDTMIKNTILYGTGTMWVKTNVAFTRAEPVYKLTIHYKDRQAFHVKNAYNIKVVRHKSGGYDIEYDYDKKVSRGTEFGKETIESDVHIETSTHDVAALTLETKKSDMPYKKDYVQFMEMK